MTSEIAVEDLVYPFDRTDPDAPHPTYAWLREHHPVARVRTRYETEAWLVTGYDAVRAVLADERFSSRMPMTGQPERAAPEDDPNKALFNLDPPRHTQLRQLQASFYTAAHVRQLQPAMTRIAEALVDDIERAGRPADLVPRFIHPLITESLWHALDIPARLLPEFREWAHEFESFTEPVWDPDPATNPILRNRVRIRKLMQQVVAERRERPGDNDLPSRLLAAYDAGDLLDEAELLVQLTGMVIAGHDPTANAMGLLLLTTLGDPDRYHRRLAELPKEIPAVVEETLRHAGQSDIGFVRVAKADVDVAGATIRAGDVVIVVLSAANRDGAAFPDADRLDVTRADNPHVAFGHGRHHCLGAPLARALLVTAQSVLCDRLPSLRLVKPAEDVPRRMALAQFGPSELLVTW